MADASQWGWAVLSHGRADTDGTAQVSAPAYTLAIASAVPADGVFIAGPQQLNPGDSRFEPELALGAWGWEPVAPWEPTPQADHASLETSSPHESTGGAGETLRMVRVRRNDIGTRNGAASPYARRLLWAFNDFAYSPEAYNEAEHDGKPPGWMLYACRSMPSPTEARADRPPGERAWSDELVEGAVRVVDEFRAWLYLELKLHGWTRTGSDSHDASELLLGWAMAEQNRALREEYRSILAQRVAEGDADPDHLAKLTATLT
jgi:hypothetical protein